MKVILFEDSFCKVYLVSDVPADGGDTIYLIYNERTIPPEYLMFFQEEHKSSDISYRKTIEGFFIDTKFKYQVKYDF